jgi:AAA+ ATPase superfamily predicted ATPase
LELLNRLWKSPKAELLVLSGRRRVGKTRLLTHWLEVSQPRALFWTAELTSQLDQLRSFSQAVANIRHPDTPAPATFTYPSWEQAFQELTNMAQEERLVVILDGFTRLLEVDPAIVDAMQRSWDHRLEGANLLLCLSGSHTAVLERQALDYQAPLHVRATALLHLLPLGFGLTPPYFPHYSPEERMAVYAMLGGIPAYWERFDPGINLDENIRRGFLGVKHLWGDEPRLLLQDHLAEAHNYIAILRAIAHGQRTPKAIAEFSGLPETHIPAYLSKLIDTGFVERRVPVTAPPGSRLGQHHIADPFLRFYYRFLSLRQRPLSSAGVDKVLAEMKAQLDDFIAAHTWKELCQEWLLGVYDDERLPFLPDQVGAAWTRKSRVDVVGYNPMERTLILGECRWNPYPVDREALHDLVARTADIVPQDDAWRVFYLGFARRGWTDAALAFSEEMSTEAVEGENWGAVGMTLLDLEGVDRDLAAWIV